MTREQIIQFSRDCSESIGKSIASDLKKGGLDIDEALYAKMWAQTLMNQAVSPFMDYMLPTEDSD